MVSPTLPPPEMHSSFLPEGRGVHNIQYILYFYTQAQAQVTLPPPEMYSSFLPEGRPCHNIQCTEFRNTPSFYAPLR